MEVTDPISIQSLQLNNRLVMPPMARRMAENGNVPSALCKYYSERALGGYLGLIIVEHCYVDKLGRANPKQVSLGDDADLFGLQQLVRSIHAAGSTKVFAQLNHAGVASETADIGGGPVGPSAAWVHHPWSPDAVLPHELTQEEIAGLVAKYANAAIRVRYAGFDGVEIHSAHGYLLDQFYSPLTNQRHDAYGCDSVENRVRFHVEIIRAVRNAVGAAYPIALRLGACDYMEGGSTIADGVAAAKIFEKEGIDLLDISGGMCGYTRPGHEEAGYFGDAAKAIKQAVSIPVMTTGGVRSLEDANRLLANGTADLIGVGRPILQDALWAKKALQGT